MSLQAEINDLKERVVRLEGATRRTTRGRVNMTGAARYLGKSREWLRQRINRGEGPSFAADGSISFDELDSYAEQGATA